MWSKTEMLVFGSAFVVVLVVGLLIWFLADKEKFSGSDDQDVVLAHIFLSDIAKEKLLSSDNKQFKDGVNILQSVLGKKVVVDVRNLPTTCNMEYPGILVLELPNSGGQKISLPFGKTLSKIGDDFANIYQRVMPWSSTLYYPKD